MLVILLYLKCNSLRQGATLPALMAMMSQWVPKNERARLGALIYSGIYAGNIIGPNLSQFIKLNIFNESIEGWNFVFYTFGFIGIIWFGIWVSRALLLILHKMSKRKKSKNIATKCFIEIRKSCYVCTYLGPERI